jgi:hypothetical protein
MATFEESFVYPLILLLVGAGVSGVLVAWLTNMWQDRRTERENKLEDRRKQLENELEDRRQRQQNDLEDLRKKREVEVEDHRKELEIRVDIVSKMSEFVADMLSNAAIYYDRKIRTFDATAEKASSESFQESYTDAYTIRSKLESYFPGADIKQRWERYFPVLGYFSSAASLFFLENPTDEQRNNLEEYLKRIRKYFSDDKQINWDRLTTEITYDINQWYAIMRLIRERGDEITKDILKLPMKLS